ncbi:MAG: hypothetical protein GKR91_01645 [Pseudomonadales bacterium]|nr:hypothetical protein [Pseudomonadales bacterium]
MLRSHKPKQSLSNHQVINSNTLSSIGRSSRAFNTLCLTVALLLGTNSFAQEGTFDNDIFIIPYVEVDGSFYRLELHLIPNLDPPEFELIAYSETSIAPELYASSFFDGYLFVPDVIIDGLSYWIELHQSGETSFELNDYGENLAQNKNSLDSSSIQPDWQRLEGGASDIGIGADGSVWVIGTDERPGGYGIYFWTGFDWQRVDGAAVRIDVDPYGNPWIVNDSHQIYYWNGGGWTRLQGDARDVGIGADGTVWIAAGGGIYRWDGYDWERTSGSAVRIDVDPFGTPWVVDHTDDIYELIRGRWIKRPGGARDIGIGADGSVWVIGTSSGSGGHDIFRWNGNFWVQVFGSARQISVDPEGIPWVLGTGGEIYRGL